MKLTLTAIICTLLSAEMVAARSVPSSATESVLTVCILMSAKVSLDERERSLMLNEAERLWRPQGVTIQPGERDGCDRLIVAKSADEARPEDLPPEVVLGWVPFVDGRARAEIFLRVKRAQFLVGELRPRTRPYAMTRLLVARFLGRVLAHELGHGLLNSAQHQRFGLMRAQYLAQDMFSPISTYTLNPSERARYFAETGKSIRVAQR